MLRYVKGFVLLIVLLFLQIFSLIGLYILEAGWIENKLSQNVLQKLELSNQLLYQLRLIEQEMQDHIPECKIMTTSAQELLKQPLSWWQNVACTGNMQSISYYYVIESLGEDFCAYVGHPSKGIIADYYRLSFYGYSEVKGEKMLLQSTFIIAHQANHLCDQQYHQVRLGRQSLSQLI